MEKIFTKRIPTALAYAVFCAAVFLCLFFMLKPVLAGWELHSPLVRYTPDFFAFDFSVSLHTLLLSNKFLAQFAYYPALGAAVCALLYTLMAFLVNLTAGMFVPRENRFLLPGFLAVAFLLPSLATTFCLWPLILTCVAGSGVIWRLSRCWHPVLRLAVRTLLLVFLTFYIREYVLFATLLFILLEVADTLTAQDPGKVLIKRVWPRTGIRMAAILAVTVVTGLCFHYLWRPFHFFSKTYAWILLFPAGTQFLSIPFRFFYTRHFAVFFQWFACLCLFAAPFFHYLNRLPKRTFRRVCAALWLLAAVPFFTLPASGRNSSVFFKADALMREWKWNEALELLDADFERQNKQQINSEFMAYTTQLKCALLATRQASEKIFSYNNPLFPALFPNSVLNSFEPYSLAVYYGYSGMFAEALHANYDWITSGTVNAAVIKEIIRTELIYNNLVAAKFTYMLETSLFRKREARKVYNLEDVKIRRDLERARTLVSNEDYGIEAYSPDRNILQRGFRQQQNIYFYEYFITLLLVYKDYHSITYDFNRLNRFYPAGLPHPVQQALMANFNYSPDRIDYPIQPEGVSPETLHDYWEFLYDEQTYHNGGMTFDAFIEKWHNTFWFYHLYMITKNEQFNL